MSAGSDKVLQGRQRSGSKFDTERAQPMKISSLLCLPLLLAACASSPYYAKDCRNSIGCGSAAVNPSFGPIQSQAVAPERPARFPFD